MRETERKKKKANEEAIPDFGSLQINKEKYLHFINVCFNLHKIQLLMLNYLVFSFLFA